MKWFRLWPIGLVIVGTVVIVAAQQPVTVISGIIAATESGTWTMQPGNTANTTPWLVTPYQNSATLFSNAAALADATSNPTTTGIGSYNMCWNGATWDRCKASTTNAGAADATTARVVNDPFWGGSLVKGTTGSMTGTTSTSVISAVASNYLYVTQCVITQSSTTVGTAINLQDGSGGTTLYTLPAPAAANSVVVTGAVIPFPSPIKVPTLGNALYAANVTTSSAVILSCSGFASTVSR